MGTKQAEIDYPNQLNAAERRWLITKPFGTFNRDESRRLFQDFSTILTLISRHQPTARSILDLGCGPGWLSLFLGEMGYRTSGYDLSPGMIRVAQDRAAASATRSAPFAIGDMEERIEREVGRHD